MQLSNAKEIVLNQNAEWTRVMSDEPERQSLLRYGMIMIAIVSAIQFGLALISHTGLGALVSSTTYIVTYAVINFAFGIATLYFIPWTLAAIAPSFGGTNDSLNALKLLIFAATPSWIGTSVAKLPYLGWLVALAGVVFSIYLFWQHVSDAMSISAEKKVGYVVVSVIVLAVIYMVIGGIGFAIALSAARF